jgi:hypothetical protein
MKFLCGNGGIVPGQFSAPSGLILWCISHGDLEVVSSMMLQAALWWSLIEPDGISGAHSHCEAHRRSNKVKQGLQACQPAVQVHKGGLSMSKRSVSEQQWLLSPGLKEAPVLDLMCSHFVLTLAARQGAKFNVRRDLNSLLVTLGPASGLAPARTAAPA